jgi:hypothetical protein
MGGAGSGMPPARPITGLLWMDPPDRGQPTDKSEFICELKVA